MVLQRGLPSREQISLSTEMQDLQVLNGRIAVVALPLGAAKWMTFPSALNMLTSSIA